MIRIIDRLPWPEEFHRIRHLVLHEESGITDDQVHKVLRHCPHLESIVLSGIRDTTNRTIVSLALTAPYLEGINLSNCHEVTDVGVLELTYKSLPLQWIQLNHTSISDPSVSAIARTCPHLVEFELCDLPLITAMSVREIWTFSRKLRTLRLANCSLLTDKAFPSYSSSNTSSLVDANGEKPLPACPTTWLDELPPLILRHSTENLRILDIGGCDKITDNAVQGLVRHAPRLQSLTLSKCTLLTDRAIDAICDLEQLDLLDLSHVANITDPAIVRLARFCINLRSVDVSFCRNLTDMSVFELAGLASLRRLSLVRVHITDQALFFLAEHAPWLERLRVSFCDRLSLDCIHFMLKKLSNLQHFTATGVPSLVRRRGIQRFSEIPPLNHDAGQQNVFRVFNGSNVARLRAFLDKEEKRLRESEMKNIPFSPRSDDELDLY